MVKHLLSCLALALSAAGSANTPLWLRDVQISPSGAEIAFCYKGDIYKVPAGGGEARRTKSPQLLRQTGKRYCSVLLCRIQPAVPYSLLSQ